MAPITHPMKSANCKRLSCSSFAYLVGALEFLIGVIVSTNLCSSEDFGRDVRIAYPTEVSSDIFQEWFQSAAGTTGKSSRRWKNRTPWRFVRNSMSDPEFPLRCNYVVLQLLEN